MLQARTDSAFVVQSAETVAGVAALSLQQWIAWMLNGSQHCRLQKVPPTQLCHHEAKTCLYGESEAPVFLRSRCPRHSLLLALGGPVVPR